MEKKLTAEQQVFIVQCLARFMSPTEVVEAVKDEFAIDVTRELVRQYNPEQIKKIAQKWKDLFGDTRKEFLQSIGSIGIAHQVYRLGQLQAMASQARKAKNFGLAAQLLEQAAKERGGQYTNKVKVQVQDKRERLAELLRTPKEQLPEEKPTVH